MPGFQWRNRSGKYQYSLAAVWVVTGLVILGCVVVDGVRFGKESGARAESGDPEPSPTEVVIASPTVATTEGGRATPELSPPTSKETPLPVSRGDTEAFRAVNGTWKIEWDRSEGGAVLDIRNGVGTFTTDYLFWMEERMSYQKANEGEGSFLLVGSNPVFYETKVSLPGYHPDKILFRPQIDGSYKLYIKNDNVITDWEYLTDIRQQIGDWKFKFGEYHAWLTVTRREGIYLQQTPVKVIQKLHGETTPKGYSFQGSDIVVEGTNVRPPGYKDDYFDFKISSANRFSYEIKTWKDSEPSRTVRIKSYKPH